MIFFRKFYILHLLFPQTYEPFIFLELEYLNFGDRNFLRNWGCLQICQLRDLLGLEGHDWLASTALKLPKIQIFKFRKIKGWCVWGNDICISTFWECKYLSKIFKFLYQCFARLRCWKKCPGFTKPTCWINSCFAEDTFLKPKSCKTLI